MNTIRRFFQRGDILAIGFGMTVAMWAVGYICRLPAVMAPSPIVLIGMLACILGGGYISGRYTQSGWRGGLYAGLLSALLNLLILGGLLTSGQSERLFLSAMIGVPGFFLVSALLAICGAYIGQQSARTPYQEVEWTGVLAQVAGVAVFFLLIVGGLVTSSESGLAVVDWPNSFGYNMFLYPVSRMTGGIYYEHAHRLFGSLVGLTTIVLAVHLWLTDSRNWLRWLSVLAVVLVIVQGILGGLRVTGHFTLSDSPEVTQPNIYLAIIHGVLGQVFFGIIVAIAVFTSKTWKSDLTITLRPGVGADHGLSSLLVLLLLVQLIYGAAVRHIAGGLLVHITLASIILLNAIASGVRAWGLYENQPVLQRLGLSVISLVVLQIVLGVLALVGAGFTQVQQQVSVADLALTTAHQANGAVLLAFSIMLMLWSRRLLKLPVAESSVQANVS